MIIRWQAVWPFRHLEHLEKLIRATEKPEPKLRGAKVYLYFLSLILLGERVDAFSTYTLEDK